MGYTNIQTKLLHAKKSTYTDSANPDLRHPVLPAANGAYDTVQRRWWMNQGVVRDRDEQVVFMQFEADALAAIAKKAVWFGTTRVEKSDYFSIGLDDGYDSGVSGGAIMAVQACLASFDMTALTYNNQPGRASLEQLSEQYLTNGDHTTLYALFWDDTQGYATQESLRQALLYGIACACVNGDPLPSDSTAMYYGVTIPISAYRTCIQVHTADIQLEAENLSPVHGSYVPPNAACAVSWSVKDIDAYFTQKPVQASFEVRYSTGSGSPEASSATWKTLTGTTDATATIPASDMSGIEWVMWQVRLVSDDGITGEWSALQTCTCVNQTGKATALSPDGASIVPGESVVFLWEHSSVSGKAQAGVQIQMRPSNAVSYTDIYSGSTTLRRGVIVLPDSISSIAGQAAWRVRTRDAAGAWSAWSDPLYVYIVTAADAPAVSSVSVGTARPTVTWQSANQTGYQVRVRDAAGRTVYDSGVLPGAEQRHQITDYLPDGDYVVSVVIWNQYAIESAEGTKTFTVSAPALPAAQIRCGGVKGGVRVRIDTKPLTRLLLLRDGVPVLEVSASDSTVYDWGAGAGVHEYKLRAENANSFSESVSSWAAPEIRCGILSTADEPGRQVHMRINRDASPGHDDDLMLEVTQRAFQGRALPVAEFTGRMTHTHRHTFSLLHPEELKLLLEVVLSEKTLLYRDPFGRRYFCICPALPISYDKYSNDISLDLEEVDYKEDLT